MELGRTEDSLGLELGGERGIGVGELVDGAVGAVVEPPGAAEVDDPDAAFEPGGSPFPRGLMRQGEEDEVDSGGFDELPTEGLDRRESPAAAAGELGLKLLERDAPGFVGDAAEEERWRLLQARVGQQQAGELASGVAASPGDRGADGAQLSQDNPRFWPSARGPAFRPGR